MSEAETLTECFTLIFLFIEIFSSEFLRKKSMFRIKKKKKKREQTTAITNYTKYTKNCVLKCDSITYGLNLNNFSDLNYTLIPLTKSYC